MSELLLLRDLCEKYNCQLQITQNFIYVTCYRFIDHRTFGYKKHFTWKEIERLGVQGVADTITKELEEDYVYV